VVSDQSLKYLTIDNFKPGIVSNIRLPTFYGANFSTQIPGTAAEGTIGCVATASGALTPLPIQQSQTTYKVSKTLPGLSIMYITMLGAGGPIGTQLTNLNDELYIGIHYVTGTGGPPPVAPFTLKYDFNVVPLNGDTISTTTFSGTSGNVTGISSFPTWGSTFEWTRMIDSAFATPGRPSGVSEWTELGTGYPSGLKKLIIYSNPTSPTSGTPYSTDTTRAYQLIAHSGRIIALNFLGYQHGNSTSQTNELITYTDPPNSYQFTANPTYLDPQVPGAYGSWGSISFGELLLVKRSGGALLVSGDIYAPSVTRLPGVKSTGALCNKGTLSPAGLIYCVDGDGAYLWGGGNDSKKISTISDRFYDLAPGTYGNPGTNTSAGVTIQHCLWGEFCVFPNGWVYDTVNESWWQLRRTAAAITYMAAGIAKPNILWTLPKSYLFNVGAGASVSVDVAPYFYDRNVPDSQYTWVGQPTRVTPDSQIDIREIAIEIASPAQVLSYGTSFQIQVWLADITGVYNAAVNDNINLTSSLPITFRYKCGVRSYEIAPMITIIATGSPAVAPNLLSLSFGWNESVPSMMGN
jgi:hypothetical protein